MNSSTAVLSFFILLAPSHTSMISSNGCGDANNLENGPQLNVQAHEGRNASSEEGRNASSNLVFRAPARKIRLICRNFYYLCLSATTRRGYEQSIHGRCRRDIFADRPVQKLNLGTFLHIRLAPGGRGPLRVSLRNFSDACESCPSLYIFFFHGISPCVQMQRLCTACYWGARTCRGTGETADYNQNLPQ